MINFFLCSVHKKYGFSTTIFGLVFIFGKVALKCACQDEAASGLCMRACALSGQLST